MMGLPKLPGIDHNPPYVAYARPNLDSRNIASTAGFKSIGFGAASTDADHFDVSTFEKEDIEGMKDYAKRGWRHAFVGGLKGMGRFFTEWNFTSPAVMSIALGTAFGAISALGTPVAIVTVPTSIATLAGFYLIWNFFQGFGQERETQNHARRLLKQIEGKT